MGILSRRLGINALSLEDPSQPLIPPSALFESLGLGRSDAGVLVNEAQAWRITTAQVCVRIISEDLASNAHEIHQNMPDGSMRLAAEHRLWPLLHDQPNPHMTAKVFWGCLLACAVGWGNGYAWIKRDRAARVVSLVPLKPGLTSPMHVKGADGNQRLIYGTTQTPTGAVAYIEPGDILHVKGLSFDGIVGMSPIRTCMNAFGLALAAEKFGAQFFGNGARSSAVLTHPGILEDEAYENLKKSVHEWATGENALRPIVLEQGMTWNQASVPPNDAQFIATRQFQRTEIAGLFRVPLHLVGDLTRATNNNIEHQSLDYVRYCLRPWAVACEQEVNQKLLGNGFTMEHNFQDMMRGDFASQTAGFQVLRNNGIYSANDCLKAMRQNPIPEDEGGDIRIVQGAMIPLTALLAAEDQPAVLETAGTDSDEGSSQPFNRIVPAFRKLFRDAVGRTINRQGERDFTRRAFHPTVTAMAQAMVAMRFGHCDLTLRELDAINALTDSLVDMAGAWVKKDAGSIAVRVTQHIFSGLTKEIG
jgi:HK97 family phage portal protein